MVDPATGGSNGSVGELGWMGMADSWLMVDPTEQCIAATPPQPH